jgi:hypothetical protein
MLMLIGMLLWMKTFHLGQSKFPIFWSSVFCSRAYNTKTIEKRSGKDVHLLEDSLYLEAMTKMFHPPLLETISMNKNLMKGNKSMMFCLLHKI